ncbi:T9SS type B sorting domain-containing protein [Flavobacterium ponti]|uniref:T9SS type B sorting domain-containing protein n=1 Tax=Flavobacterium ponti TaxID=665133 RepID=A0ABV9P0S5_9FLAO
MKTKISVFFLFLGMLVSYAQGEANIWYFGENAGLDFNSGAPVALTDGQLVTEEGCATISNSLGQLLFYTDGSVVYNKNHQVMVNGTGLLGNYSSTQSATIVPKPGSSNLYYIFTTDNEHDPNGFRYSIVDMTLDSGNGAVTSDKNILIYTPTIENIGITKHANGIDFWIVTHGWNSNNFNTYLLTSAGLSNSPVITPIGFTISGNGFQAAGHIRLSPSGSKLAITSTADFVQLFDFNTNTGVLSNSKTLLIEPGELYGVAFSPDESVLYVTQSVGGKLYQFDLTAPNIGSSKITLFSGTIQNRPGALQLGPDNKIYVALFDLTKIGVINNPNIIGVGCNFQYNVIDLAGKISKSGLPSFNQSFFFAPAIQLQNACVGEATSFQLNNSAVTSISWDFGDGFTSNELNPTHSYTAAGTYTVSVTATSPSGVGTNTRDIIISEIPTATQPVAMKICDSNNDGFAPFDLTQQNSVILNGQSASQYQIKYFASAADYASNTSIVNPTSYTNATAFGLQTIIAEVSNVANTNCKITTNFTIQVFKTAVAPTSIPAIRACDNTSFGTDNDGKNVFDLTQNEMFILNGQSLSEFSVSYYTDSSFINQITTPTNYVNTNAVETIYVKITTIANINCFASTSFAIEVYSLPIVNPTVSLKQCDDDNDGFSAFNLTEANQLLVASTSGLSFSYFESAIDAQNNVSAITNTTTYTNQLVSNDVIYVRVTNANGCFRVVPLNLIVSTTLIPASFQRTFISCDTMISGSNSDGISTFNFSSVTNEIQALYPTGQLLNISYYKNLADALAEVNAIVNISNYTNVGYPNTQNIYVRVDSQLNNECLGLGHHITLTVEPLPIVQPQIITNCDDDQDGFYSFDTSSLENTLLNGLTNVSVAYTDSNGMSLSSPLPNPFVSSSQTIIVTVTNITTQACSSNTTIQFIVDDLPEAFPIPTNLTTICDDEIDPLLQNGMYAFDTSTFQSTILGTQTGMLVNYFDENGNTLPSPLPNPFTTTTQNILVEVINPINSSCKVTLTIPFKVNQLPILTLTDTELVCSDDPTFTKVIDAGLLNPSTSSNFTYEWYFNDTLISGATNYNLTINTAGIYTVDVTNNNGCTITRTITVTASNRAVIDVIEVTDFSENNTIQVFATGLGDYVYSLNGLHYQDSSIFSNIPVGTYILYIKDLKGCDLKTETIYVMGVPKFFTPNGDGYNDFWNIKNYNPNEIAKVNIFDRYGKLLHQFNPKIKGWDGKYNGQDVLATDYWYLIEFEKGKIVKGHFSLIR